MPRPIPQSKRPSLIMSSIAPSSASRIGWWKGSTFTAGPSLMRAVRWAAEATIRLGEAIML